LKCFSFIPAAVGTITVANGIPRCQQAHKQPPTGGHWPWSSTCCEESGGHLIGGQRAQVVDHGRAAVNCAHHLCQVWQPRHPPATHQTPLQCQACTLHQCMPALLTALIRSEYAAHLGPASALWRNTGPLAYTHMVDSLQPQTRTAALLNIKLTRYVACQLRAGRPTRHSPVRPARRKG